MIHLHTVLLYQPNTEGGLETLGELFFFFTKARIWMMDGWQGDLPLGRHHIIRVEHKVLHGVKKKPQRQTLLLLECTCQFDSSPVGLQHFFA